MEKFIAANVVVATGTFQQPRIPSFSNNISDEIFQVHSSQYRNPRQLPTGTVLVVGSGQSGCQIAEELHEHERKVFLSTGRAGRLPRRYRGDDAARWLVKMGIADKTVDQLPSPAARFKSNPHASGKAGGRTLNLHHFSQDGITLLGHLSDGHQMSITVEPDLHENLAAADTFAARFKQGVDQYIKSHGLRAPVDGKPEPRDGFEAPIITELDLEAANIQTIIWATGYNFDFSWVKFPIFDEYGYPIQQRGVTSHPGLYFLGLHWLHTSGSSLLSGVGDDAAYLAEHIESRGETT
jgi:putative flavoprotein involved in K+ transport